MLKKNIVFTALVGLAFTVNAPVPASGRGYCEKHRYTGSGRGPTKSSAKFAARQKWKFEVLSIGLLRESLWRYSKEQSTSCHKKFYGYKCWARAIPCRPGDVIDDGFRKANLDRWCKKKVGRKYKAKLIGKTAGDWVCQYIGRGPIGPGIARRTGISVGGACKMQYGNRLKGVKALNWNDPYSWRCEVLK